MASSLLHTEVVRDDERVAVLRVAGEIDLASAPDLADALRAFGMDSPQTVHLDFGGVTFLDSSGISVLVESRRRLDEAGGGLVLHRVSPAILRVLQISGVDGLFSLDPAAPE